MDEAGTSAREPVSVVVGIIADADHDLVVADKLVEEALCSVPHSLQDGFRFHAKQVLGDRKYQEAGWSLTNRLELLYSMMSIPKRVGMAVCVGVHWRGAVDWKPDGNLAKNGLSAAQSDHFMAFFNCVGVADRNIRRHAAPTEVASIVAEDIPEMRRNLNVALSTLQNNVINFSRSELRETKKDKEAGYCVQDGEMTVKRVRNSIHFIPKATDPMIQVADACAFGFRRYFNTQKFGSDFVKAVLDDPAHLRAFGPPGGAECYWFKKP